MDHYRDAYAGDNFAHNQMVGHSPEIAFVVFVFLGLELKLLTLRVCVLTLQKPTPTINPVLSNLNTNLHTNFNPNLKCIFFKNTSSITHTHTTALGIL